MKLLIFNFVNLNILFNKISLYNIHLINNLFNTFINDYFLI